MTDEITVDMLVISDHAAWRYLQRFIGMEVEEDEIRGNSFIEIIKRDMKQKLITEQIFNAIITLGDGEYPVTNNFYIVVRNMVVTTILLKIKKELSNEKNNN